MFTTVDSQREYSARFRDVTRSSARPGTTMPRLCAEQERIARQRAVFVSVDNALDGCIVTRRAVSDEERQEMLLGGMCTRGFRRFVAVIDEGAGIVRGELRIEPA